MAQLSAQLLDRQCNSATSVLQVLSRRAGLRSALRGRDRQAALRHLGSAVDLVPDLLFVAAYRPDGGLLASHLGDSVATPKRKPVAPSRFTVPRSLSAPYVSSVTRLPDPERTPVLALGVPVRTGRAADGALLAYYRLREIDSLTRQLRPGGGGVLYIVDGRGRVLASSGGSIAGADFVGYAPVRRAKAGQPGAMAAPAPGGQGGVLVGYAFAAIPEWSVLVVQPLEAALAPTQYLLRRLALLVVPFVLLVLAAAWGLWRSYRRQEEMARQLASQNEQLRAVDKAKSDFLANVSHDLRTPLASLQVSISGLLDPVVSWSPEQVRETLALAGEGLEQLNVRVRNLLEMSRIEAKAYPLHRDPCDLTDIVGSALERLGPVMQGRPVEVDFPKEALLFDCDAAQVETVVVNLLENAAKYSPSGTALRLRGQRRHGAVLFSVRDDGPGVPPGSEERVFEKFYRVPEHHAIGGTGLGLAICKAIVEAHGGVIGVRNIPGGGCEFSFSLPALAAAEDWG